MREINYEIKKGKKNRNRSRRKKKGREEERGGSNKKKSWKMIWDVVHWLKNHSDLHYGVSMFLVSWNIYKIRRDKIGFVMTPRGTEPPVPHGVCKVGAVRISSYCLLIYYK